MKLARFRHFVGAVATEEALTGGNHNPHVYRIYQGEWFDQNEGQVIDKKLIGELTSAASSSTIYSRGRSQTHCYFRVPELSAVVRLEFQSSPTTPTQKLFAKQVASCFLNSSNAFDATHDSLTELFNRPAFEERIDRAIREAMEPPANREISPTPVSSQGSSFGFVLLAFDLDHFKQVNDSYGHPYGDVVLQSFSWRLWDAVDNLAKQEKLRQTVSRFGGEEFYVLLVGASDSGMTMEFAETLRKALTKDVLPTEEQWKILSGEKGIDPALLPHQADRKLTASIGHTTFSGTSQDSETVMNIRAKLLKEVDTALYRAKADGRDCCRSFQSIRDKFARILEHHSETNIVAIDIGENVGVQVGQEYLVYHPQFAGGYPFHHSDGRTKRRLGDYPRKSCGRISVFSVAREISFCTVTENQLLVSFPVGARLEYIPIGVIAPHLGETSMVTVAPLLPLPELQARLLDLYIEDAPFVACAFSVKGLEELSAKKGVSHANLVLASVFRSIQEHLPRDSCVSQDKIGQNFGFITLLPTKLDKNETEALLKRVVDPITRLVAIGAGAYCESTGDPIAMHAIELAKLTSNTGKAIDVYSEGTPLAALLYLRGQDRSEAVSVFRQLVGLEIPVTAGLANIAGLCYLEKTDPDLEEACRLFALACQLEPSARHHGLNLGYSEFQRDEYGRAYAVLRKHHQAIVSNEVGYLGYLVAYAVSGYYCLKNGIELPDRAEVVEAASAAIASENLQQWLDPASIKVLDDFRSTSRPDVTP